MGSYNGDRFIGEQLDTIGAQSHTEWVLVVSDDGSTDDTIDLLRAFQKKWGENKVRIRRGPGRGFCKNFLSLACEPGTETDYYAFSDQDDLWDPKKLSVAIDTLKAIPNNVPALYCGPTDYINIIGQPLGRSRIKKNTPNLNNALVQCLAGGNTMVFNEPARKLIASIGSNIDVPSHDWWLYILVTASGGKVKYDCEPMISYRQHNRNIVGGHHYLFSKIFRAIKLFNGQFKIWNSKHLKVLKKNFAILDPESIILIQEFDKMRSANLIERLIKFRALKIKRDQMIEQFGLILAVMMGKF